MRILYFSRGLLNIAGGAEFAASMILQNLLNKDIELTIITDYRKHQTQKLKELYLAHNVKVIYYTPPTQVPLINYFLEPKLVEKKIHKEIKRKEYDLIHIHQYAGYSFSIESQIPVLITFHDEPSYSYWNSYIKGPFGWIDSLWSKSCKYLRLKKLNNKFFFHALSFSIMCDLKKQGIPEKQIFYLPNGVVPPKEVRMSKMHFKEKWNITDSDIVLFSIGNITYRKAPHDVVAALCQSNNKNLKLFLIGSPAQIVGSYYIKKMKKLAEKCGCRVLFTGKLPLEDVLSFYAYGDYFISSSYSEACQLSLLEAKSYGCNVIMTKTGCGSEFKSPNDYVYNHGKIEQLTSILNQLSKSNKRCFVKLLSWDEVSASLYKKYELILNS